MLKFAEIAHTSKLSVEMENKMKFMNKVVELEDNIKVWGQVEEDADEEGRISVDGHNLWGKTYEMPTGEEFFITEDGRIFIIISLNKQIEVIEAPDTFAVWEGHIDDLRKKVASVKRKCQKFDCDFTYEEIGEAYKMVASNETDPFTGKPLMFKCKFILVHASGTAVINDWEFVSSVEHTHAGNIFSKALTDVQIPMKYRTTGSCICEHCNTNRTRKDTFIIRNTKSGEFKQVGKSCLQDFTNGMSASVATWYASIKDIFTEAEERPVSGLKWYEKYYDTKEFLQYTAETIRHFGYSKSENVGDSTKDRVDKFFNLMHGNTRWWTPEVIEETKNLMTAVGFNAESPEAIKMTEDALAWLAGQDDTDSDYIHNLKVVIANGSVTSRRFGLLVSIFPAYDKDLEIQAKKKREAEAGKTSKHVGTVGQRLEIEVQSIKCITSWESCYNGYSSTTTYVWKVVDKEGNIFTWKTSNWMNKDLPPVRIKGTVKEHKEYNGVLQTEITRCRIFDK